MISTGKQAIVVGLTLVAVFVNKTVSNALRCEDPDYLPHYKNEVRPFYTMTSGSLADLQQQGPCSYADGNQIGKPRWSVYTMEPWHAEMSTCPWSIHIDEDINGFRYPCRIATARLISDDLEDQTNSGDRRCLSALGSRHHRSDRKVCKQLMQDVPVVTRSGCHHGVNVYAITNMTITVGFTCTFDFEE